MKILVTRKFEKALAGLPEEIQRIADQKIALLAENIHHPSLRLKKIAGTGNIWEASVTMSYRMTLQRFPDGYLLRNIGTHDILKRKGNG
jgi:mRNA-degrading endonuclease RelE of RelBE toxin-antitoxin system